MPTVDLPGMRSMRTDSACMRQAEIVGEPGDLAVLHAGVGLELEGGDDRARDESGRPALDGELAALVLEQPRAIHQLAFVDLALGLGRVEQRERRQRVAAHAALDRRARDGVGLAQRQRRRRGATARLARRDGRRFGRAARRGRRGARLPSSVVDGGGRLGSAFARAARRRQRDLCGFGRAGRRLASSCAWR